jgi:flagellar basal body-associated protein FliL
MDNLLIVFMVLFVVSFIAALVFLALWRIEKQNHDSLKRQYMSYIETGDFRRKWEAWDKGPKRTKRGIPIPPPALPPYINRRKR